MVIASLTNGETVKIDKTLSFVTDAVITGKVIEARAKVEGGMQGKELLIYAAHIVHFREVSSS